ncbi:DUF1772 domain-containing protein [Nocardia sp. BSTN01]|nr:DUF1772 domain-containing protein [Nocardia sp. BSTN01]
MGPAVSGEQTGTRARQRQSRGSVRGLVVHPLSGDQYAEIDRRHKRFDHLRRIGALGQLPASDRPRHDRQRVPDPIAEDVFLVTRFGNVPINQQIKRWAVGTPPADYADILRRWELFHFTRTGCAVMAFILVIVAVVGFTSTDDNIGRMRENPHRSPSIQRAGER